MKTIKILLNNSLPGVAVIAVLLFGNMPTFAQSGIILSWDSEVGCLDYDYDKDREAPIETIGDADCLLVCEESDVSFSVDYGTQPVTDINWNADGGQIVSLSNGDATAEIHWPGAMPNGSVTVEITLADGQVIGGTICVAVKDKPHAEFEVLGAVSQSFCSETELIFDNLSYVPDGTQIVASVWDFGDGTTSNEFNPTHTYQAEGEYEIELTVYDECGCSNIWRTTVSVVKPGIVMECPTAVCEGALETYTLLGPAYANGDVNCQTYQWSVVGGQLVNQAQDRIQVYWNNPGPDGFGYIYFDQTSCDVYCDNQLVIKVPVIPTKGTITGGATELCQGDQSRYALPQWPATDVTWSVYPDGNPGNIISGATILVDQRNEIVVDGAQLQPGDYVLHADYINTLLSCGGEAYFHFSVREKLEIDENLTSAEICEGHSADFFLTQTISNTTWTIAQNGQTVADVPGTGSGSQGTYQFDDPGLYSIEVTANGYCTDYANIKVIGIPSVTNAEILGATEVCPAQGEIYTFDGETNGFEIEWTVDHGDFLGSNVGESVTIKFDVGYSDFEVSAQLVHPQYGNCASDPVVLPVELFAPDAQLVQTTGHPGAICTSSEENFELQGYGDMDHYEWTILPAELGNVAAGDGTESVTILFNEPYLGQTQGTIAVSAKVCGTMTQLDQVNFELNQAPALTVTDAPAAICANESFDIEVSSSLPFNPSYLSISFTAPLIGTSPGATQMSPGVYEFQNIAFYNANPNENTVVGYTITADGPDLCEEIQISGTIERHAAPVVDISHVNSTTFCDAQDINTILYANLQVSTTSITWMYGGNPVGTGASLDLGALSGAGFGDYTAIADNGYCQTVSEAVTIEQDCGSADPAPCTGESAAITGVWTDCNEITLTATYSGSPLAKGFMPQTGFTAEHTTPFSPSDVGNVHTQVLETDASGIYLFAFVAEYASCNLTEMIQVNVEYKPAMLQSIVCDANGDYEVTIFNESTYLDGSNPQVNYTFAAVPGGQTIPPDAQNNSQATATLGNGDFSLTLTLGSAGNPTCGVSENITLQKPLADFTLTDTEVCSDTEVVLQPDVSTPGASYLWEFQGASNTLEHIHPNLGGTNVNSGEIILTVTDPYGCSDIHVDTIVVYEPNFEGEITPQSADICQSQPVDLLYYNFPTFDEPNAYQWLHNTLEISGATSEDLIGITQPGEYAVYLYDDFGCLDKTISSAYINQIQPPHLAAQISGSFCQGDGTSINGTLSPDNTEYKIWRSLNANPFVVVQDWTTGPEVDYTHTSPSVGTYIYKVEYKDTQTDCIAEKLFEAEVHPTPTVFIQLNHVTCSPYTIQLTATGNLPGTYLWSNGMSGASITVDHGGPYQVTFIPEGAGCSATATYMAPKSPDVYSWIFPTGCFTYCEDHGNHPYLIGPIPSFDKYAYVIDGVPIADGTGAVPNLVFANNVHGPLTLTLDNYYCEITTDVLDVTVQSCKPCKIPFKMDKAVEIQDPGGMVYYRILGTGIQNTYAFPITVHLSSDYGVFVPAYISIPAYGAYSFANNPVDFFPYNPLQGPTQIAYAVSGNDGSGDKIHCRSHAYIDFADISQFQEGGGGTVLMRVVPNPAIQAAEVQYRVEDLPDYEGGIIKLFDLTGRQINSQKTSEISGRIHFDLSTLPSGTYVIVFFGNNQRLGQQIIIKQ